MNVTAAQFSCSPIKVSLEHDRSLKLHPPLSPAMFLSLLPKTMRSVLCCISKPIVVTLLTVVYFFRVPYLYFFHSFYCISLSIIQKWHFIWCCIPPMSLTKNNGDVQNAKRHIGVSLIAAESYQSSKQMAYQSHGFVLDMSTLLRGDL